MLHVISCYWTRSFRTLPWIYRKLCCPSGRGGRIRDNDMDESTLCVSSGQKWPLAAQGLLRVLQRHKWDLFAMGINSGGTELECAHCLKRKWPDIKTYCDLQWHWMAWLVHQAHRKKKEVWRRVLWVNIWEPKPWWSLSCMFIPTRENSPCKNYKRRFNS